VGAFFGTVDLCAALGLVVWHGHEMSFGFATAFVACQLRFGAALIAPSLPRRGQARQTGEGGPCGVGWRSGLSVAPPAPAT
jgi:hypothetical protein